MKGVYRFTLADIETAEQWAIVRHIDMLRKAGVTFQQEMVEMIRRLNALCSIQVKVVENVVPIVGRHLIADNLTNASPTNTMLINRVGLGTGTTAPDENDTTLETETYRNAVASRTSEDEVAYVTGFFNATEVEGEFKEAGLFSDATDTEDSGILVSRVAIDQTKSLVQTLTVDWELHFLIPSGS